MPESDEFSPFFSSQMQVRALLQLTSVIVKSTNDLMDFSSNANEENLKLYSILLKLHRETFLFALKINSLGSDTSSCVYFLLTMLKYAAEKN